MIHATLRTSDDVILANNTSGGMAVSTLILANTSSARRTVRVHHVGQGQASSTINAILYDASIAPNSSLVLDTRINVKAGESLRGLADAVGVTVTIYGGTA